MPDRIKFTDEWVKNVEPPAKGRKSWYDSVSTSLVLIVTAKGSKSFYRAGRPSRVFIGHPEKGWTVANARKKCNLIVGQIASGQDPVAQKKKKQTGKTLEEAWNWYLEDYAKIHKRTWPRDVRHWKYFAAWKDRKLSSITRDEVVSLVNATIEKRGPSSAQTQMALLFSILSQCVKNKWIDESPAKGVTLPKTNKRSRYLTDKELPVFFSELAKFPQGFRDFMNLAVFTSARRTNLNSIQFSEISGGIWTIPASKSKNKKPMRIPLTEALQEIVKRRRGEVEGDYLFPSTRGSAGHKMHHRAEWDRLRKKVGLKDFRFHDIRHVLPTWAIGSGVSLEVIGEMLGHKNRESTLIYAKVDLDPVREAIKTASEAIQNAINKNS